MPIRRPKRVIFLAAFAILAAAVARPAWHLLRTRLSDRSAAEPLSPGVTDDASRLNRTEVADIWRIPSDPQQAEKQLSLLLERVKRDGLRLSIAGARHSMGGHTIYPGGIVLDMLSFNRMELDEETGILQVQSGARWSEIIPYLDAKGWSVAVMQSNDSFSVGGSISVNCHGWQHNHAPIASTVAAFRLLKADGTIVRCSRKENQELFKLVLGGYGLFGVILDVDLRVTPNQRYRVERFFIAADEYVRTFEREVNGARGAGMVYGRLSVASDGFLEEAILNVFRIAPAPDGRLPALTDPELVSLKRTIFRGSADSDYGKELRWKAEKRLQQVLDRKFFSRNQLLNESAEVFADRSAESTDILHEYFIPPAQFNAFLRKLREIIPRHNGDLLNVTVRNVACDHDAFLRYADRDLFSFVMLFNQSRLPEGETRMAAMTRELIDAALSLGGRYYLPYRLHATVEQFERAYPEARQFFELKRRYDPDELFQNQFYMRYGQPRSKPPEREEDTDIGANASAADTSAAGPE